MQVGDQDPDEAQEAEDQERIVDPQKAARVAVHANICSPEQPFSCKNSGRHNRITVALPLALALVVALCAACLPDPHRAQTVDLLDQLNTARGLLNQASPELDSGCTIVGYVQTRLYGEPGLVDIQPAWPQLRDAAIALQAVCGQATLLMRESTGSLAVQDAHARWQQGIHHEIDVACDHLRAAASALSRDPPC